MNWRDYQEEAARFFRELGFDAQTDARVKGVRTEHDVDVLVTSKHAGFDLTWVVECKCWNSRVSKLHVLGLRQIVSDLGADRGILLSESGFQSGAIEAAALTNVQVTSIAEARDRASENIYALRLVDLNDRTDSSLKRYWVLPKDVRIRAGLRPEFPQDGYSGQVMLGIIQDVLRRALGGRYPFEPEGMHFVMESVLPKTYQSPAEVVTVIEPLILEVEAKLLHAEALWQAGNV